MLLQQLALLRGFDLAAMDPDGPDFVHVVQECAKLAFADREVYYGDPAFADVPLATLLSDAYNAERRALVGDEASLELRPGMIPGHGGSFTPRQAGTTSIAHPETTFEHDETDAPDSRSFEQYLALTHGDTCHLDVDRPAREHGVGHARAAAGCPARPSVPGLGFPVSVRGQMFSLDRRHPNAVAPGKRPRTTLTPGLALRGGEPYLAFGTPGGDCQDQWALHAFLRHVHHGQNLQQAIDAPELPHRARGRLLLPARVAARPPGGRGHVRPRHPRRARPARPPARDRASVRATTTRSRWRPATAARCGPAPARAGSRASPSAADQAGGGSAPGSVQ